LRIRLAAQELLPPTHDYSLLPHSGERINAGEGEITELVYPGFAVAFITKACLNKVGMFDDYFHPGYYEDYDYGVRAWLEGFRVLWFPSVQYKHERGGSFSKAFPDFYPTRQANYFHAKYPFLKHGQDSREALKILKQRSKRKQW
jgi:GT2 family glycosyltransferase